MLRNAANIAVTLLLLIATSGVTISRHYCGNILVDQSILTTPEDCCDGPCNCCHNEIQVIKLTDNFELQQIRNMGSPGVKTLLDHANNHPVLLLPGHDIPFREPLFLPIKDPFAVRMPAGDHEAVLQCFLL